MNIKAVDSICLWSENPEKLAKFYEETLGLKVDEYMNLPNDRGVLFKIGKVYFFVGFHDQIHGKAKDPYRVMIAFTVPSVQVAYEELISKGVEFIQKPEPSPDKTFYVTTAFDPEGNIIQFYSYDNP